MIKPHLYHAHLSEFTPNLFDYLSPDDQQKALAKQNPSRYQMFVMGRALLAKALKMLTDCPDYQLDYNEAGKPLLCSPNDWHFNLTHSDEHLFLIIQPHHSIGIDSEYLKPRNFQRLAEKIFTPQQCQSIETADDPLIRFYQLWTRHEALVKQLGLSVFSNTTNGLHEQCYFHSYHYANLLITICNHRPLESPPAFFHYTAKENILYSTQLIEIK